MVISRIATLKGDSMDKPFIFGCDMDKADLLVENQYLREQIQRFTDTGLPPLTVSECETLRAIFKPSTHENMNFSYNAINKS